jgi:hypothetical protein
MANENGGSEMTFEQALRAMREGEKVRREKRR